MRCATSSSHPRAGDGRHGEVLAEVELLGRPGQLGQHLGGRRQVDLVHHHHRVGWHPRRHEAVPGPDGGGGVHDQAHHVHVADGPGGRAVQALAQQRARLVDAGRVDEHDLRVGAVEHAPHLGPRRLGLVRHDADLAAEDGVEQRRLAHVGSPHERDEAGPHDETPRRSEASASSPGWRRSRSRPGALDLGGGGDAHPTDAAALHPLGREVEPLAAGHLALDRHVAEQVEHQPPDRVPVALGQGGVHQLVDLVDGHGRVDPQSPSASRSTMASSRSYSSWISPTSSSIRSSSVTSPAVPPYSSTTMARWT